MNLITDHEMIDFHAHILPAADHGSDCLKTSLRQVALAREAGVDVVIATPHFYPQTDRVDEFLTRRERAYCQLKNAVTAPPHLLLGAEVHICAGIDHMEELGQLCVAGTKVLLIELPFSGWSASIEKTILRLQDESEFTPVLAHVDRYDPKKIEDLFSQGLLGQVNVSSLCRLRERRRLRRWIDEGCVVALGSDIHGTKIGYTHFTKAMHRLTDSQVQALMRRTRHLLHKAD